MILENRPYIPGHGVAALYDGQLSVRRNLSDKMPEFPAVRVREIIAQKDQVESFGVEYIQRLPSTPGRRDPVSCIFQQKLQLGKQIIISIDE